MGVTLGARFVAYDPAGERRGILPYPLAAATRDVFNDISGGTLDYLADAQHSPLLEGLCEIAAEVNDGGGWTEFGARMMRLKRGGSEIEETRTRRYTLQSYGMQLTKMRMLREESLDENGERVISSATVGSVIKTLFDEAKNRGAVTAFTYDFTAAADSNGQAWGSTLPPLSLRFGDDLLSLLRMLADNGSCDWKIQGRTLRVFKPDTLGTDKSAAIQLFNGADIVEAPDDEDATEMAGRIGVIGDEGRTYEAISPSMNSWGLWEETVNASGVKDIGGLQYIGEAEQRRRSGPRVQMTRKVRTVNARYLPIIDYAVGDTITVPGQNGTPAAVRVRELQLDLSSDGLAVNATLNDLILERDIRDRRNWQGMLGASSSSGGSGTPTTGGDDKRKPAVPTGLVCSTVQLWSPTGEPYSVLDSAFVPVTTGTDGRSIAVSKHEMFARKNTTGEPWRLLTVAASGESRITFSPLPSGEDWQFKLRAVSQSGVLGGFSAAVSLKMAVDTTPPPKPAPPTGQSRLGQMIISWSGATADGTPQPLDFSHGEVLMATAPAGPAAPVGQIGAADTFVVPEQPYNAQRWFSLVGVDTSGNRSDESSRIVLTVKPLVDTDVIGRIIDGANVKLESIQGDVLAAKAVSEGKISDAVNGKIAQGIADAASAQSAATTALAAANGKNTIIHSTAAATGAGKEGDTWFRRDGSGNIIGMWSHTAGEWVPRPITDTVIANLDAAKITSGFIRAERIAANAITAEKLAIGDFTNYADGSDFEDDARNPWALTPSFTLTSMTAQTGLRSLRMVGTANGNAVLNVKIPAKPGDSFYIEFWMRRDASWNGLTANSKLRFGSGSFVAALSYAATDAPANVWTQRSTSFTVPEGDHTNLSVMLVNQDSTTGACYLDNIVIRRMSGAEVIIDGSMTADKVAANAVTAAKIAAGAVVAGKIAANAVGANEVIANSLTANEIAANAITASELAALSVEAGHVKANAITADKIEAGAVTAVKLAALAVTADKVAARAITADKLTLGNTMNLIDDPGFTVPVGQVWVTSNAWSIVSTGEGRALECFTKGVYAWIQNNPAVASVPVVPGERYQLQVKVYQTLSEGTARVQVSFLDEAGASVQNQYLNATAASWSEVQRECLVPAGAATMRTRFEVVSTTASTTGRALFTKPRLIRKADSELIVDGSIDGKTITGATVQTLALNNRGVKLTASGLAAYNGAGVQTVDIDSATGAATFSGTIRNRPSGPRVEMNSSDTRGIIRFHTGTAGSEPASITSDPNGEGLLLFGGKVSGGVRFSTVQLYEQGANNSATWAIGQVNGSKQWEGPRVYSNSDSWLIVGRSDAHRMLLNANGYTQFVGNGVQVWGDFATYNGTKNFIMDHPTRPGMQLKHASTESPHNGVEYWSDGFLTIPESGELVIALPGYFEALTAADHRIVMLSAGSPSADLWSTPIVDGQFVVHGAPGAQFTWLVKARRLRVVDGVDLLAFEVEEGSSPEPIPEPEPAPNE